MTIILPTNKPKIFPFTFLIYFSILFSIKIQAYNPQEWINKNNISATYLYQVLKEQTDSIWASTKHLKDIKTSVNIASSWSKKYHLPLLIAFLGLIGLFLLWQNYSYKKRIKREIQDLKQQTLQVQMKPHFISNVLSSIQKLLITNSREEAILYLSIFSNLTRSVFDYSKKKEISLEKEINFLKDYLKLEKLRFKEKIKIDFKIDPTLKDYLDIIKIPPLLLQPLIENAFNHGLFHKDENRYLLIKFSMKKEFLQFTIEDNGIGRVASQIINHSNLQYKSHHSSGIKIIKERLSIINRKKERPYMPFFKIEDLYDKGEAIGTRVHLSIYCKNFN